MTIELAFPPVLVRWMVLGAGVLLLVLAWLTDDMFWARRYKRGRYTGREYEVEPSAMEGGFTRLLAFLAGIGLVAAGVAWPWVVDALGLRFVRG